MNNTNELEQEQEQETELILKTLFGSEDQTDKGQNLNFNIFAIFQDKNRNINKFFRPSQIGDAIKHIRSIKNQCHIYCCMGFLNDAIAHNDQGKRGCATDVIGISSLWLEMDVKGPGHKETNLPETKEEAKELLENLLPGYHPTYMVDSGGGIYAFWVFQKPWFFHNEEERLSAAELEKRLLRKLKSETRKRGWKPDNVSDLSRIMRLAGTFNLKVADDIRVAKIIQSDPNRTYSIEELSNQIPVEPDSSQRTTKKTRQSNPKYPSQDTPESSKADYDLICSRCAFMGHAQENAQNLPEPDWYAFLSIAARCKNGHEICHTHSEPFPDYDSEETDKKIHRALNDTGPYKCDTISEKCSSIFCDTCHFNGVIKSPIKLGFLNVNWDEIAEAILEMNQNHAGVMLGGKFCILNEIFDPVFNREDISFSTVQDFKNCYINQTVPVKTGSNGNIKYISKAEIWFKSPNRRDYKGIVFSPKDKYPDFYNLFRGFPYEEGVKGDWSLFKKFILEVIASNDEQLCDWVIAWVARILQDPGGDRPGTSIVLKGPMGVGKGTFAKYVGKMFGHYYLQVNNPEHLVGKFNSHLKNALLVFCDEGFWAGDKVGEGVIKGMVTEDRFMIEPKGKDAYSVKNFINLLIASNNKWVVPAGLQERRFCSIKVSDAFIQQHGYFAAIDDQMEHGGIEAMVYDLMKLDISSINLRKIPQTKELMEQKIQSMPSFEQYWLSCLEEGIIGDAEELSEWKNGTPFVVECDVVWKDYIKYCQMIKQNHPIGKPQFGIALRDLFPGTRKSRTRKYDGKRVNTYILPPLDVCQGIFDKATNYQNDWMTEEEEQPVEEVKEQSGELKGIEGDNHRCDRITYFDWEDMGEGGLEKEASVAITS